MERFIRTKGTTNFRTGPTTDAKVIKNLAPATELQVLEDAAGTWYKAKLADGTVGYITSKEQYVQSFVPEWLAKAQAVVQWIERQMNAVKPYEFGSKRFDDKSFDCSDLMQQAFYDAAGLRLPGDSRSQSGAGTGIGTGFNVLRSGDLVFFDTNGDGVINHVALYVYPNKILHTASNKLKIHYDEYVDGSWYRVRETGARRVL